MPTSGVLIHKCKNYAICEFSTAFVLLSSKTSFNLLILIIYYRNIIDNVFIKETERTLII